MKKITKDMTFEEAINENPEVSSILAENGLMCATCPMAQSETIEQGCEAHGIDVEDILEKVNKE